MNMSFRARPSGVALPRTSRPKTLLCLSHLRWNFVFQRPQHLMTRAARHFRVVFFEEPVFEDSRSHLRVMKTADGVEVATPVLPLGLTATECEFLQKSLLRSLLTGVEDSELLVWCYSPMLHPLVRGHTPALTVYDCMDELSAFRFAPPQIIERESELMAQADLVFTGGRSLYEAKKPKHAAVHEFPSSIDANHFGKARKPGADPGDQIALGRPRIGFFGVIDERFDVDLLGAIATMRPEWQFVVIGPIVKIDPATLPQNSNIAWLGPKQYIDLPAYLRHWDAGMMPFAINEATRFISPTKTPEFLAAGLPVVSTPVRDVVSSFGQRKLVAIADSPETFVEGLEQALASPRKAFLARVDSHLAHLSWDKTWSAMLHQMNRAMDAAYPSTNSHSAAIAEGSAAHV